ncbi:hypothetical protein FGO68_gene8682 [Halteria grandinella]|uniref:Uncharacterized protein n=1 Tax=Halteria grandinella TaxID=5974 RepID=A0A8J8NS49_HALGN|nr:hypothetical protein FGO68_gene8682 [Halteria grandinella]
MDPLLDPAHIATPFTISLWLSSKTEAINTKNRDKTEFFLKQELAESINEKEESKNIYLETLKHQKIIEEQLGDLRDVKDLVVIGNSMVGKSAFLRNLTQMKDLLNLLKGRQDSTIWRFSIEPDYKQEAPYVLQTFLINSEALTNGSNKQDKF